MLVLVLVIVIDSLEYPYRRTKKLLKTTVLFSRRKREGAAAAGLRGRPPNPNNHNCGAGARGMANESILRKHSLAGLFRIVLVSWRVERFLNHGWTWRGSAATKMRRCGPGSSPECGIKTIRNAKNSKEARRIAKKFLSEKQDVD